MINILRFKLRLSFVVLGLLVLFLLCNSAQATVIHPNFSDSNYKAQYYSQSLPDPIKIEAGQSQQVIVRFKNIGLKSWSPSDDNYVSVYTYNNKYRPSDFSNSSWLNNNHPTKVSQITKVGEIGEFKINLTAPKKIGNYKEEFYLASENNSWIEGGYFYLKLNVVKAKTIAQSLDIHIKSFNNELELGDSGDEVKLLQATLKDLGYYTYPKITGYFGLVTKKAVVAYQKATNLAPYPGLVGPQTRKKLNIVISQKSKVKSQVTEKNVNSKMKINKQINTSTPNRLTDTSDAEQLDSTSSTIPTSPTSPYSAKVNLISASSIKSQPGEIINVQLQAENNGTKTWAGYQWRLLGVYNNSGRVDNVLVSHKSWLTDKKVLVASESVSSDSSISSLFSLRAPHLKGNYKIKFILVSQDHKILNSNFELSVQVDKNADDSYHPDIKIPDRDNIFLDNEPLIKVGLYSPTEPLKVKTSQQYAVYEEGNFKGYLPANTIASLNYSNGSYTYSDGNLSFNSNQPIKLKSIKPNSYFEITNYTRTVSWQTKTNYNKYLGNLELKTTHNGTLYAINELLLDDYIKGIRETDDNSNMEYIKSTLIAARSYAYEKLKRSSGVFDIYATTRDQLYLGYNSQLIMPNVVKAVIDTYGEMVTYKGEVVTTPYFGHSDGMTRSWSQVWGGPDKPWLQPVVAKYDKGLSMYGHGIGMSNRDASFRAVKDGWNYKQILKYYYTGVEVEQIY